MKTYSVKPSDIKREWHVIDVSDQILGRVSTQIAKLLMGKHKPIFARNIDTGDFVVVLNAEKVRFTGDKLKQKFYYRHSGYPGALKTTSLEEKMQSDPTWVIKHAVRGMLPRNRLGASMIKKLKVYVGNTHPHLAKTEGASKRVKS